jgi:N-ethylmaleimide reductase
MRSDPGDIPSELMVEYYKQRTTKGGLIISEASPVSIRGNGYVGAPGIYSDTQIAGWQRVTEAVHAKGRPHLPAIVARRPAVACRPAAERGRAGRAVRHRGRGLRVLQARRGSVLDAARARGA